MQLTSERLLYEKFQIEDFDKYFEIARNEAIMKMITGKGLTEDAARLRFEKVLALNKVDKETGVFIVYKRDNTFIGLSKTVWYEGRNLEIGYALLTDYWGQGYGTEISKKMTDYSKKIKDVIALKALINPLNIPSKRILLKCGFEFEREYAEKNDITAVYHSNI